MPGALTVGACLVAVASLSADAAGITGALPRFGTPFDMDEDTVRDLLSTLAGAMVTAVSLVFSLTLVTLTVAAGNLGVRLLERYMQNWVTQVTIGLFVGTFVFSVAVLSRVGGEPMPVPALSVALALLSALVAVGWLVFAFHDLARSLQIDQAVAAIGVSMTEHIDAAAELGARCADVTVGEVPEDGPDCVVRAGAAGYVEAVDWDALGGLAEGHGVLVELRVAQGDHVTPVDPLAVLHGTDELPPGLEAGVRAAVVLGSVRTEADDVMFLQHLLIEISARALSPAVNDQYTAMVCADHVTAALVHAFQRQLRPVTIRDVGGRLLVLSRSVDLQRMIDTAFTGLRRNGAHHGAFSVRLVENIGRLAPVAAGHELAPTLLRHLERIVEHALEQAPAADRAAIDAAAAAVRATFGPARQAYCAGTEA